MSLSPLKLRLLKRFAFIGQVVGCILLFGLGLTSERSGLPFVSAGLCVLALSFLLWLYCKHSERKASGNHHSRTDTAYSDTKVAWWAASIIALALIVWCLRLLEADPNPRKSGRVRGPDDFDQIVQQLTFLRGSDSSKINGSMMNALKAAEEAARTLRARKTTFLPRLMEEVYFVGQVEATNRSAARLLSDRLAPVFEVLGSEARPLLPKLKEEFTAGRCIGPCILAFHYIGGTESGLALVAGLTNADPYIRNGALSMISSFHTNREVALSAVNPLLKLLQDESTFARAGSASALGSLRIDGDVVLRSLLAVARADADFVVRAMAVKAIGNFGTNAAVLKVDLQTISSADEDPRVRRAAVAALRAVEGDINNTAHEEK